MLRDIFLFGAAGKNSLKLRLSARKYRPQRLQDIWGHKFSDAPNIVACNLLYQRGAQIKIFVRGHQKNSLDFAVKMAVHLRHLKLKLKVGNRPQAAYDGARARIADKIDSQAVERLDPHIFNSLQIFFKKALSCVEVEQRPLPRIARHRDNNFVK